MADDFLSPIIDVMKTILVANLPGEIDDLDTSLEDIPSAFMHKSMQMTHVQFPSMEIFPSAQSALDPHYTYGTIDFDWRIATIVNLQANDENEGELNMRKYMTAVIKSLEKGTVSGNEMKLDGKARFAGPILVDFAGAGERGNLLFAVLIMWEVRKSEDTLA